nr:uncharacterized protein LOC117849379 [Setaria viridis]
MEPGQTARALYVAIENLFQVNRAPRAIFLSHEFHSMTQGDSSIDDYCQCMKTAADALRDIGHLVLEPTLVLNILRGLNKRYSTCGDNIAALPVLTFASARNQLILKELRLANEDQVSASTALLAAGPSSSSCPASGCRNTTSSSTSAGGQQQHGNAGSGRRSRHNKRSGNPAAGQSSAPRPTTPTGSWVCINPWALQQGGAQQADGSSWWAPLPQQ